MNDEELGQLTVLVADNRRLREWVNDLQSEMYINCVYCGHRYGPRDNVPPTMADVLKAHIATCEKHPMSKLLRCAKAADHLISSLLAHREGATDDLLQRVQGAIQEAIAAATTSTPTPGETRS